MHKARSCCKSITRSIGNEKPEISKIGGKTALLRVIEKLFLTREKRSCE